MQQVYVFPLYMADSMLQALSCECDLTDFRVFFLHGG